MSDEADSLAIQCKVCGLNIPRKATLCYHCNSHQDWRRHLSISNTALALLVALFSVMSTAVPPLYAWINRHSKTHLSIASMDEKIIRLVATNEGFEPSIIEGADIILSQLPPTSRLELVGNSALISNGSRQIDFKVRLGLTGEQAYSRSINLIRDALSENPTILGKVKIRIRESDRSSIATNYPIDASVVFAMLRKHADECDDVSKPTFTNDCLGGGAEKEP